MKAVMLAGQLHFMEWPADADRLKSPARLQQRPGLPLLPLGLASKVARVSDLEHGAPLLLLPVITVEVDPLLVLHLGLELEQGWVARSLGGEPSRAGAPSYVGQARSEVGGGGGCCWSPGIMLAIASRC